MRFSAKCCKYFKSKKSGSTIVILLLKKTYRRWLSNCVKDGPNFFFMKRRIFSKTATVTILKPSPMNSSRKTVSDSVVTQSLKFFFPQPDNSKQTNQGFVNQNYYSSSKITMASDAWFNRWIVTGLFSGSDAIFKVTSLPLNRPVTIHRLNQASKCHSYLG